MDNHYIITQIQDIENRIRETEQLLSDPVMAPLALEEIQQLKTQKEELERAMNSVNYEPSNHMSNTSSRLDQRNIILEVKGAAGGNEAKIWAKELLRMYFKYAEQKKLRTEILDDWTCKVSGPSTFALFKYEAGVHRVQRVPETEKRGRIHTSTAVVSILPELEDIDLHIKDEDVAFDAFRSGGHGGQNVNKVSTAVRLKHIPSSIVVTCQTERQQAQNRELAMKMLRAKLWEQELSKRHEELNELKSTQVGKGDRSEKIRTYNFPQDRVTDHRIGKSWRNLEEVMNGSLDEIIAEVKTQLEQPQNTVLPPATAHTQ